MARRQRLSLEEVHARYVVLHGARRAAYALLGARLLAAQRELEGARERREAAEARVMRAVNVLAKKKESENEWMAIVHGLALEVARYLDARPAVPREGSTSKELAAMLADDSLFPAPRPKCEHESARRCASNTCTRVTGPRCSVSRETHSVRCRNYGGWCNVRGVPGGWCGDGWAVDPEA